MPAQWQIRNKFDLQLHSRAQSIQQLLIGTEESSRKMSDSESLDKDSSSRNRHNIHSRINRRRKSRGSYNISLESENNDKSRINEHYPIQDG